jgi:hypothetical protein
MVTTTVKRWDFEARRPKDVEIEVCCEALAFAMQDGTDGEGYASLVQGFTFDQGFYFAGSTSQARYCPWCGRDTEPEQPCCRKGKG